MVKPPEPPAGLAPASPREWMRVWARVRAQPSVKLVGAMAAHFADYRDGSEIRPGSVILAAVCGEMNERTVKIALTQIRDWGLLWRYVEGSRQGRRGMADEYRLTIPEDVFERVPMLTPEYEPPVDNPPDQVISDHVMRPEQVISEHVISEHVICTSGTGDLSDTEQVISDHPTYTKHLNQNTHANFPSHLRDGHLGGALSTDPDQSNGKLVPSRLERAALRAVAQSRASRQEPA